jgi:gluconolactonase
VKKQPWPIPHGGRLVANTSGFRNFDSLAVEANGNICIATLFDPGITVMTPDGSKVEHVPISGDPYCTNICFGGPDLKTAYITLSYYGTLVAVDWPRPGLALNYLNK